jgi:hypothetical protein
VEWELKEILGEWYRKMRIDIVRDLDGMRRAVTAKREAHNTERHPFQQ